MRRLCPLSDGGYWAIRLAGSSKWKSLVFIQKPPSEFAGFEHKFLLISHIFPHNYNTIITDLGKAVHYEKAVEEKVTVTAVACLYFVQMAHNSL
jgi:hypothetical protein